LQTADSQFVTNLDDRADEGSQELQFEDWSIRVGEGIQEIYVKDWQEDSKRPKSEPDEIFGLYTPLVRHK
jgi:hypothetical protein